jgi:putative flippase GtrA
MFLRKSVCTELAKDKTTMGTIVRYLIVGTLTNLFWYGIYIIGTWSGVPPLAMATISYLLAVVTSYAFNRQWSFSSSRPHAQAGPRYIVAYGIGYLNQMAWLYGLTYGLAIRHEISQLLAAGTTAILIFGILRFWVFATSRKAPQA